MTEADTIAVGDPIPRLSARSNSLLPRGDLDHLQIGGIDQLG